MKKPTIREWMEQHASEHSTAGDLAQACMRALGVRKCGRIYRLAGECHAAQHTAAAAARGARRTQRRRHTFEELRAQQDLSFMIPKAIEQVAAEWLVDGCWMPDSEMLSEVVAIVPRARSRWAQYRGLEEYAHMQSKTRDGKLIWIDPKAKAAADRMRAT